MSPEKLEAWLVGEAAPDIDALGLRRLQETLLDTLRKGIFVTDSAVIHIVKASARYASSAGAIEAETGIDHVRRFIGMLLPHTYGRQALQAQLYSLRAGYAGYTGDYASECKDLDSAIQVLDPLRITIDITRQENLVQYANKLYLLRDHGRAESLYMEALSYDWAKVRDKTAFDLLKDLYIQAGRGLIQCRRGRLDDLRITYFYPAVMDELGAELRNAIDEAESDAAWTAPSKPHEQIAATDAANQSLKGAAVDKAGDSASGGMLGSISALTCPTLEVDFGEVSGTLLEISNRFSLINKGETPIVISHFAPSCDCASAVVNGNRLPVGVSVGEQIDVDVTVDLGGLYGAASKYIKVISEPAKTPVAILKLTGAVIR